MITVTPRADVLEHDAAAARSAELEARSVVAEYLYDWGLREPETIATESRRIVEEARETLEAMGEDMTAPVLREAAIAVTCDEVEQAIARMATVHGSASQMPGAVSIVPRLAPLLRAYPEAVRYRDRPPAQLLAVMEDSVSTIVPTTPRRQMCPVPRTRLWKALRRGYWRRVIRYWRRVIRGAQTVWNYHFQGR